MFRKVLQKIMARLRIWGGIFLSPAIRVFLLVCAFIRFLEWAIGKLPPNWQQKMGGIMIPHLSWQIWIIGILTGLIILILESAYRLISRKEKEFNEQLSQNEKDFKFQISQKEQEFKIKEDKLNNQVTLLQNEIDKFRRKEQDEAEIFVLLQRVCEKVFRELEREPVPLGYSGDFIRKETRIMEELNQIGWYVAQNTDVYGKRSSTANFEPIDRDEFLIPERIKQGASVLMWPEGYVNMGPRFIELSIRKDKIQDAIEKAKSIMRGKPGYPKP